MFIQERYFYMETVEHAESLKIHPFPVRQTPVLLVNTGISMFFLAGKNPSDLAPGHGILLPAGDSFSILSPESVSCLYLAVEQAYMDTGLLPDKIMHILQSENRRMFPLEPGTLSSIMELFQKLVRAHEKKDWLYTAFRYSWVAEIFIHALSSIAVLGEEDETARCSAPAIRQVISYLEENYTEPISIDMLAAKFYISKYHLMRQFKKESGYTIHSFIVNRRVNHACRLIHAGISPSKACYLSGFTDYSLFYKAFTKATGSRPSSYGSVAAARRIPVCQEG